MESSRIEGCKVIPSCFQTETSDGPVSVLANGSSFLYIVASEKVVRLSVHVCALDLAYSTGLCEIF